MNQIDPKTVIAWQKSDKQFYLLDVRELYEHEAFNIGGFLLPMGDLMNNQSEIPKDAPVVLYCEKGIRSAIAIQRLEGLGFSNLINLQGGMKAWRAWMETGEH